MTKRHINYLLEILKQPFKYVTVNNEPYLLKDNGSLIRLELNNHYDLADF